MVEQSWPLLLTHASRRHSTEMLQALVIIKLATFAALGDRR
jgi:hypothetical protein